MKTKKKERVAARSRALKTVASTQLSGSSVAQEPEICKSVASAPGDVQSLVEEDYPPYEDRWLLKRSSFLLQTMAEETELRFDDEATWRIIRQAADYYRKFLEAPRGAKPVYRYLCWEALLGERPERPGKGAR